MSQIYLCKNIAKSSAHNCPLFFNVSSDMAPDIFAFSLRPRHSSAATTTVIVSIELRASHATQATVYQSYKQTENKEAKTKRQKNTNKLTIS